MTSIFTTGTKKMTAISGMDSPTRTQLLLNADARFALTDKERDIIAHHMWPLNLTKIPRSREALLVCLVDKYCSTVETLTKRSAQA